MINIKKFEELEIRKLAGIVCKQIIELTNKEGAGKDYSLND